MRSLLFAILWSLGPLAAAAELTLFDLTLRGSSRAQVRDAIEQAGAQRIKASPDIDEYDVKAVGLPGAETLEVVFVNDVFVLARYVIDGSGATGERLRKMRRTKYGDPTGGAAFASEYLSEGKYRWHFDGNMELVYTKNFFRTVHLTYVDRAQLKKLEQLVRQMERDTVSSETKRLHKAF